MFAALTMALEHHEETYQKLNEYERRIRHYVYDV